MMRDGELIAKANELARELGGVFISLGLVRGIIDKCQFDFNSDKSVCLVCDYEWAHGAPTLHARDCPIGILAIAAEIERA